MPGVCDPVCSGKKEIRVERVVFDISILLPWDTPSQDVLCWRYHAWDKCAVLGGHEAFVVCSTECRLSQ